MRSLVLTSNGIRHKYFAETISKNSELVGIISNPKSNYYDSEKKESKFVREHFKNLEKTEKLFFGETIDFPSVDHFVVSKDLLNDDSTVDWAISKNPEIIFLFGTSILKGKWLTHFEGKIVNLHLGYSPFYRGSATLFWPFYFNELEFLGATIHLAIAKVDAGAILEVVQPDFEIGDDYYTLNYKTIKKAISLMVPATEKYISGSLIPSVQPKKIGRLCKKNDFNEGVLLKVLDDIKGGLTSAKLDQIKGKINGTIGN